MWEFSELVVVSDDGEAWWARWEVEVSVFVFSVVVSEEEREDYEEDEEDGQEVHCFVLFGVVWCGVGWCCVVLCLWRLWW